MDRRRFLQHALVGIAVVSTSTRPLSRGLRAVAEAAPAVGRIDLTMRQALVEMVDGRQVAMWVYDVPGLGMRYPGPAILVEAGASVEVTLTNALDEEHSFALAPGPAHRFPDLTPPGLPRRTFESPVLAPGETTTFVFEAPPPGTYVYFDRVNEPVGQFMGLGGPLVVLPPDGSQTPYDHPPAEIAALFADLGHSDFFPGQPWRPERTRLWVMSSVDADANDHVAALPPGLHPDPLELLASYTPDYFMLNGRSGIFSAHAPDTEIEGFIGEPMLIRSVNLGAALHSPHIHGNHVYVLNNEATGDLMNVVRSADTWPVLPRGAIDVLLPFIRPPDAYPWPPSDPSIFTTDLSGAGSTGMVYPVHCHTEMSQSAAGGNYPMGLITHWEIIGDPLSFPDLFHYPSEGH